MIEEYVIKLAELQADVKGYEYAADNESFLIDENIETVKKELNDLIEERKTLRRPFTEMMEEIQTTIESLRETIIDEWTGEKKTMVFDAGTLKFRTSKSLEILDGGRLLGHIIEKTSAAEAASKYLKGFLLTPTKAYVDVHALGEGIAKINSKTTVKLEQKSG